MPKGLAVLTTLAASLAIAACGGDDDQESTEPASGTTQFDTTPKSEQRPAPEPVDLAAVKSCLLRIGSGGKTSSIARTVGSFASVESGATEGAADTLIVRFRRSPGGASSTTLALIGDYATRADAAKAKAQVERQLDADREGDGLTEPGSAAKKRSEFNEVFAYSNIVGEVSHGELETVGRAKRCLGAPDEDGYRECETAAPFNQAPGQHDKAAVERCRERFLEPRPPGRGSAP